MARSQSQLQSITYLSVVVGELVPKTLALKKPTKIMLAGASAPFVADRVLSPIISLLEWSTKKILKIFFRKSKAPLPSDQAPIEIVQLAASEKNRKSVLLITCARRRVLPSVQIKNNFER